MKSKLIDGIRVDYEGEMDEAELAAYVQRGLDKYGGNLRSVLCIPEDDYVGITYTVKDVKFKRLRRITGYLVGDLNRWNDAKRAEEHDRVKHEVEG